MIFCSFTDLNLKCCECKSTFSSASKLLQHFADHALKNVKIKLKCDIVSNAHRKKRQNSQVSVQPESGSDSSPSRQDSTLSAMSDTCSESSSHDQSPTCILAKFDLQKRLESCVGNLCTTKRESDSTCLTDLYIKREPEQNVSVTSPVNSHDYKAEEYSPLKFCMITMDEGDDSGQKKGASRKQPLPKKIERKVNSMRKLAPKPAGTVVEVQSQSLGKKKYACHLCTKVFGWSTDLMIHILVHTGERPFKCKTCQATFTRNFLLQKHQSKVHPCKPKTVLPEIVEMPTTITASYSDDEEKVDPLKEEPMSIEDDDDDDDDKLVITEEVDDKPLIPLHSDCSFNSKWTQITSTSDSRYSELKQAKIFAVSPVKVLSI